MHDGRHVGEFEHSDTGHRVWLDDTGNVHADSKEEADRHHKRGMYAEHDTSTKKKTTLASLKKHPMWSESDHKYFKDKGYNHDEIKDIWDRDLKMGKEPLVHKKAPDVVGVISDPDHNKSKQAKKQGVKNDIMRQIEDKRKENENSAAEPFAQADSNRKKWSDQPDEENPKYALGRISSKSLGQAAKGKVDLRQKAKEELAARGVDEHGKWLGFDKAEKHHGVTTDHMGGDAPDHDDVMGNFQTLHHKVLGAIAAGHTDPKRLAREDLANRGHDHDGNWIGFDKAAKLHKVE